MSFILNYKNWSNLFEQSTPTANTEPGWWNFPVLLGWYRLGKNFKNIEYITIPENEIIYFNTKPLLQDPDSDTAIPATTIALGGGGRFIAKIPLGNLFIVGNIATGSFGKPNITGEKVMMNVSTKVPDIFDKSDVSTMQLWSSTIVKRLPISNEFEKFVVDAYRVMFPNDTKIVESNANNEMLKLVIRECVKQGWVSEATEENKQKYLRRTPGEISSWNPYNMIFNMSSKYKA